MPLLVMKSIILNLAIILQRKGELVDYLNSVMCEYGSCEFSSPRGYKTFLCSTQLSMKLQLLIKPIIMEIEILYQLYNK